jgi:hypothetical protein
MQRKGSPLDMHLNCTIRVVVFARDPNEAERGHEHIEAQKCKDAQFLGQPHLGLAENHDWNGDNHQIAKDVYHAGGNSHWDHKTRAWVAFIFSS